MLNMLFHHTFWNMFQTTNIDSIYRNTEIQKVKLTFCICLPSLWWAGAVFKVYPAFWPSGKSSSADPVTPSTQWPSTIKQGERDEYYFQFNTGPLEFTNHCFRFSVAFHTNPTFVASGLNLIHIKECTCKPPKQGLQFYSITSNQKYDLISTFL